MIQAVQLLFVISGVPKRLSPPAQPHYFCTTLSESVVIYIYLISDNKNKHVNILEIVYSIKSLSRGAMYKIG